jgi:hypothetical protein
MYFCISFFLLGCLVLLSDVVVVNVFARVVVVDSDLLFLFLVNVTDNEIWAPPSHQGSYASLKNVSTASVWFWSLGLP